MAAPVWLPYQLCPPNVESAGHQKPTPPCSRLIVHDEHSYMHALDHVIPDRSYYDAHLADRRDSPDATLETH